MRKKGFYTKCLAVFERHVHSSNRGKPSSHLGEENKPTGCRDLGATSARWRFRIPVQIIELQEQQQEVKYDRKFPTQVVASCYLQSVSSSCWKWAGRAVSTRPCERTLWCFRPHSSLTQLAHFSLLGGKKKVTITGDHISIIFKIKWLKGLFSFNA